jgi:hypothetical protein
MTAHSSHCCCRRYRAGQGRHRCAVRGVRFRRSSAPRDQNGQHRNQYRPRANGHHTSHRRFHHQSRMIRVIAAGTDTRRPERNISTSRDAPAPDRLRPQIPGATRSARALWKFWSVLSERSVRKPAACVTTQESRTSPFHLGSTVRFPGGLARPARSGDAPPARAQRRHQRVKRCSTHHRGHPDRVVIQNAVGLVVGEYHPGPGRPCPSRAPQTGCFVADHVHKDRARADAQLRRCHSATPDGRHSVGEFVEGRVRAGRSRAGATRLVTAAVRELLRHGLLDS